MSMLLRRRYITVTEGAAEKAAPATSAKPKKAETENTELGYTESVINAMTGAKLRKLAKENGVENPEDLTAGELKSVLIELLVK